MRMRRYGLALTVLALATMGGARGSAAEGTAAPAAPGASAGPRVEVTVIHAIRSDAPPTLDPRLHDLAALVHEPPFARYNVFRLLDRRLLPLAPGTPVIDALVNGRQLRVELNGGPEAGRDGRFRLRAAIEQPGQSPFVKSLEVTAGRDEPFFVGGQSYLGGSLVLEFVVRSP